MRAVGAAVLFLMLGGPVRGASLDWGLAWDIPFHLPSQDLTPLRLRRAPLGEKRLAEIKDKLKNVASLPLAAGDWTMGLELGTGPVVSLRLRSKEGREVHVPLASYDPHGAPKGLLRLWHGLRLRLPGRPTEDGALYRFKLALTPFSENGRVALQALPLEDADKDAALLPLRPIRDAILGRAFAFSSSKARYWAFYETPVPDGGMRPRDSKSLIPALIILRRGADGLRWRLLRRFAAGSPPRSVSWGDETLTFETRPGGVLSVSAGT